ncbi:trehalose-phosphatase [Sulfurimonas sp.]|uniref:trehalose-phosphatase n=1 Tax=Sulfurimonas sp. TaxID=2022749 RepID=UPI0025F2100E|nr:trehalose-phosphatase [Sulfurimonas sp.]MBW6487967.1 trehalose-phosphatase [Sulfurimonas sp.]
MSIKEKYMINRSLYDAVIFDLDGVVTKTQELHAKAWKKTFDDFLKERARGTSFIPFDISKDYLKYVDGKSREDGIKSFLASRDIKDTECVEILGDAKNSYFLELVSKGVETYESSVELLLKLNNLGFLTAVVSSSKNCTSILQLAKINLYFNVTVDGFDLQNLDLKGKPEPDLFLEAAKRLRVKPSRSIVIEDAVAGVKAGKRGEFAKVIGVNRGRHSKELKKAGADLVIEDLAEIDIEANTTQLPSALQSFKKIENKFKDKEVILFFDYDGTLTPIVSHPKDANLSVEMKNILTKLSNQCSLSIISGRGLNDIKSRVGIKGICYSGSHGYEIEGPSIKMEYQPALEFVALFDKLEVELNETVSGVKGVLVERKKFSIALHYRNVANKDIAVVEKAADDALKKYPKIRKSYGKKLYELQPDLEWNKGKAVEWLIEALHIEKKGSKIFYIGDDITDEDAFNAIKTYGIGILVGNEARTTSAQYKLKDTQQTLKFLEILSSSIEKGNIWSLIYNNYTPKEEKLREVLCALGNGYFITRAAATESKANNTHYPGTYLAGGYNRLKTVIQGKEIKNEDLVNFPNWLSLKFKIQNDDWFSIDEATVLSFRQELDMQDGIFHKLINFSDAKGRETRLIEKRFVHMGNKHIASVELIIIPINWEGAIEVESGIDGNVKNEGVQRYSALSNQHLKCIEKEFESDVIFLKMETLQSNHAISMAAKTRLFIKSEPFLAEVEFIEDESYIAKRFFIESISNEAYLKIEKSISFYTSKDKAISNCYLESRLDLEDIKRFEEMLVEHKIAWGHLWDKFDIELKFTDDKKDYFLKRVLHLYIFHLLQTASVHTIDMDVGIPARGWHGEAYRGHIFWDEVFIFPFFNYRVPQITRSFILYRYRRLPEARRAAKALGYKGAMYPWQSGSNGKEETQTLHLNPHSNRWIEDNTHLQRHINSAIVYNIWQYYQVSGDNEFLYFYGAEMILEIARFWSCIATYNDSEERYEILGVVGPDEYHDAYPKSKTSGINNNAYTNIMAVFVLNKAIELQKIVSPLHFEELCEKLQIEQSEIQRWEDIRRKMKISFHDNDIISQFEGYENLKELDWDLYLQKYENIQRLDRILEAEGDSANQYKISKQADVLMLFYLFSHEELKGLFHQLGYMFSKKMLKKNSKYYLQRTSGGSSLSQVVHAWISARTNRRESWSFFNEALLTDVMDRQGGTTPEGVHIGAMAGTVDIMQRCYTGLEARDNTFILNPSLPKELDEIKLKLHYRGQWLKINIYKNMVIVETQVPNAEPISVNIKGKKFVLNGKEIRKIEYGN